MGSVVEFAKAVIKPTDSWMNWQDSAPDDVPEPVRDMLKNTSLFITGVYDKSKILQLDAQRSKWDLQLTGVKSIIEPYKNWSQGEFENIRELIEQAKSQKLLHTVLQTLWI